MDQTQLPPDGSPLMPCQPPQQCIHRHRMNTMTSQKMSS